MKVLDNITQIWTHGLKEPWYVVPDIETTEISYMNHKGWVPYLSEMPKEGEDRWKSWGKP